MGCAPSRHVNPIDAALMQALHAAKKRRGKKDFTFNELLLKFSSMASGFKEARKYFDAMDLNGDKLIDLHEFTTMVRRRPRARSAALLCCAGRCFRSDLLPQQAAASAPPPLPHPRRRAWASTWRWRTSRTCLMQRTLTKAPRWAAACSCLHGNAAGNCSGAACGMHAALTPPSHAAACSNSMRASKRAYNRPTTQHKPLHALPCAAPDRRV